MGSVATIVGLASFAVLLFFVAGILRQLGAGEAAKGLLIVTGVGFACALAMTYVPAVLAGY